MPLRLYGTEDAFTQVEFMVRADSDDDAEAAFLLLLQELQLATTLSANDFEGPILLETTLTSSNFNEVGIVNGRHIPDNLAGYEVATLLEPTASTVSTPDAAANQFAGSFTIIFWLDPVDAGSNGVIVSKDGVSPDLGWAISLQSNVIQLSVSETGATNTIYSTFLVPNFNPGLWFRVTFNAGNGDLFAYASTQGVQTAQSDLQWSQFFSVNTGFAAMNAASEPVSVGKKLGLSSTGLAGDYYRAMGIPSTDPKAQPAWDMFPEVDYNGGDTFESSLSTGEETWTLTNATIQVRY